MGKCSFLGNIIIIMGMFGGLMLKLVLMVFIGGLLDAPSRQDWQLNSVIGSRVRNRIVHPFTVLVEFGRSIWSLEVEREVRRLHKVVVVGY